MINYIDNVKEFIFPILYSLFCFITLHSQETAEFEMTLYFTDMRNNQDSIVIGYDPYGSHYHNSFEGPVLDQPFDSILDVRGTTFYDYDDFGSTFDLTKKVIAKKNPPPPILPNGCFDVVGGFIVFVQNMYPPITVTWNRDRIGSMPCLWGSFFSWDESNVLSGPWWLQTENFACMKNQDTLVHTLGEEEWGEYSAVFELNSGKHDTIYAFGVILAAPAYGLQPCPDPDIVDVDEVLEDKFSIEIYPNPGSERLRIILDQQRIDVVELDILLHSLTGQEYHVPCISKLPGEIVLDTKYLNSGIYIISVKDHKTHRLIGSQKWVKF